MNLRKSLIMILLVLCIFMVIASVSAADSDVQTISSDNSTDEHVSSNDIDEMLTEDDGSFTALNKKINVDEASFNYITLEHNYTCTGSSDVIKGYNTNTNGIYINRDITIDGQGYTIDAAGNSRIFYFRNTALSITLKNINFKNGYDTHGGAFYASTKNLDIINCTFENNYVTSNPGGAFYIVPYTCNIINCTFIGNGNSAKDGGACYIHGQYQPSVNIERSIFLDNVGNQGSAINFYSYCTASVKNSIFLNNGQNSIVKSTGTTLDFDNNWWGSTVENVNDRNSLGLSSVYPNSWLYLDINSNRGIAEVSLNNLYTYNVGCSTYADYDLPEITFAISSTNSQISKNNVTIGKTGKSSLTYNVPKNTGTLTASYNGVGLNKEIKYYDAGNFYSLARLLTYVAQDGDTIELTGDYKYDSSTDSQFKNNLWIQKSIVIDGKGHTLDGNGQTGILLVYGANVKFINITFINGLSQDNGGAIYGYGNGYEWEVINCTFINNTAPDGGGAIYSYDGLKNIINSTFINNTINGGTGSAIYCYHSSSVSNSIFVGNVGEMVIDASGNVTANYNWFGNTADNPSVPPNVGSTVTADNWYILNMTLDDANHIAEVSLNNLYGSNQIDYALPTISLNIKGNNVEIEKNRITLDNTGKATLSYTPTEKFSITASYNGVEITKNHVDYAYFTDLKNKINEDTSGEITLNQDYSFDLNADSLLLNGIEFAKTITIDGQGNIIDAKGLRNIFYFNDDSNTKNLTLKNIIFANATGTHGAAIYFNGNKLEIINCTFIKNNATQGDAIYVANAKGQNKITESLFINNTGLNSVVYINLDSTDAGLNLSNSIFISNDAVNPVKGTGNVVVDYNWWGNIDEDKINVPNVDGVTLNNWLFLKITSNTDTNIATISLNNLYDGNVVKIYENYELPSITINIKGTNATVQKTNVTLDNNGKATTAFKLLKVDAILTASFEDIETTDEIHYVIVDDGSFKALTDIIRFSSENDVIELTKDYVYSDSDTITTGIQITKTITINGNGNTIDAKGNCGIFLINSPNVVFRNITFKNGIFENGGAICASQNADYLTVENCNFINNTATNTDGGAIWSESYYFGSVVNSTFINNTAVEDGAAIFTYSYYTDAVIDKCLFINNSAQYTVIYAYYMFNCHDSIFLNNNANKLIGGKYASYGTLGNNWYGSTFDDYQNQPAPMAVSNYKWLYLNIKFNETHAIISLNNLYTSSSGSLSVYSNYNLPEITLNINSTTLDLKNKNKITLDSTGKAIVPYEMIGETGALTVSYESVSLTKDRVLPEFGLIQSLIDNADENSIIELDRDYSYNGADEITEGIIINKNITIDGKGHTIDAKEMTRIFNVQALNVTFKNIVFANGKSNLGYEKGNNGGAVYFNIDNSEFVDFNMINCTFVNNTANKNIYYSTYQGGAIYIKSNQGLYNIMDCAFINNNAVGNYGGAIYLNVKDSQVNLYNTSFIGNKAVLNGALYLETDNADISIDKCLFKENIFSSASYSSMGSAIIWNSVNDAGNNVVKNSVFMDNGYSKNNNYAFLLKSGSVTIDDNWWGTTTNNNMRLGQYFIQGTSPNSWLFLNSSVSSSKLRYNETAIIKYYLQAYDGNEVTAFDNAKLPHVDFDVSSDSAELDKDNVCFNEEFTFTKTGPGSERVNIYCNNMEFETWISGYYMAPKVEMPFIIYANQNYINKNSFIKTANGYYSHVTVTCNDSSLLRIEDSYIFAYTNEGTAKLTFSYDGYYSGYAAEDFEMVVKVVKVPLNISITNVEGNEITLNVSDTFDLDIAFEIDPIHKGYAPAWQNLGFERNFSIITFTYDDGVRPDNGSYYPTGHIKAITGGTTNLTIYCTSDKFKWENYTIKITVNMIPTEITMDNINPLKVDDESSVSANFYINGTLNTTSALTYESSDENVLKFTSGSNFKAVGNGTAIITVKFKGNSTHDNSSATITVVVTKYETTTEITSDKDISLNVDDESQITVDLTSEGTSITGTLIYTSSNESVATVDSAGKITAVGEGSAIITVKYDGNYKYANSSDSVSVTVSKIASSITLNTQNPLQINVFDEVQLNAILNHEGILSYVSGNPNIVAVNQTSGKITAKAGGRVNITISYAGDNKYAKAEDVNLTVIVSKLASHITADNAISLDVDSNKNIVATVDNGRSLRYVSTNPNIVTVDETTGVITGIIGGTANVTVIFDEDEQYLSDEVNVSVKVNKLQSSFTVANPEITVDVYGNALIQATSNNEGIITFTSCDTSLVTVDGNRITALKGGKTNVTLSVAETERCLANETNVTVTVNKLQSTINVANALSVDVDETKSLQATVDENRPLRYISINPDIVTVSSDGKITGVIGGTANVTVIFDEDDQYLSSELNVTVTVNKLQSIINVEPISVDVYQNKLLNAQITGDGAVSYASTNTGIVTVNETGYVAGVIGGKANVTITAAETSRYLAKTVNVTVTVNKLPSIFTNGPMSLSVDENATINSVLNHEGKIHYEFDPTKLNVTEDGLVIALAGGVHTITVIFDGNERYLENTSAVTVTVSRLPADYMDEPINLTVFETTNIEFMITGYNHTNSEYSSSNETVFTVDDYGLITAHVGGSAILNIKFADTDRYLGDSINITVNVKKLPSILTADSQVSINVGETKALPVSVSHNRQLIYESSNPNVITVDDNGLIKGIIGGTAFITVRYDEDGQYLANTTKVSVTVNKLPSNINVETEPITIYVDDEAGITATTDNDGGIFFTTNSSIISLSGDGKVSGVSEGTADIIIAVFETDTHLSNRTTLKVTVKKIPTVINVESLHLTVKVNDSLTINASLNHPGSLAYVSSNPEVVTVDDNGKITALIGGKANITISYAGDDKYIGAEDVNVSVTVNKLATVIEVNDTFTLKVDDKLLIGASTNHDDLQLKYASSNSSVIIVDELTGEMTAIGAGKANITISSEETDSYLKPDDVTVEVDVSKIETKIGVDNVNPIEMNVFDESAIAAVLNHPEAGILTFTSSDENIVTVDDQGLITAIGGGNANVTISYGGNDKYEASENVTVNVVVSKLSSPIIVDREISLDVDSFKSLNAYMENGRPLRYVSNDENIAIVDEYGVVTGIIGGKTNITVIFDGDSQYSGCEVNVTATVNKLASTIQVESQSLTVEVADKVEIIATTNSDASLTYISLNSSIATVDGIAVTGFIGGTVNVTVSVAESDKYLSSEVNVTITVKKHKSSIIIENATLTIDADQSVKIIATTNSDEKLSYSSQNSSIAAVEGDTVTGIIGGTVNVTVSVAESDRYSACEVNVTVTVNKLISTISVENNALSVDVDGNVLINASSNSDAILAYQSLDESVATVDGNIVTGITGGRVNVTVSVGETAKYLASQVNVTITVNKIESEIILENSSLTVDVDGKVAINATTNSDARLIYESADESIAYADDNIVTGVIGGVVNVTLSVHETSKYLSKKVNVTITVRKLQSAISLANNSLTVDADGKVMIDAVTNSDGDLSYQSLDESIAAVHGNVVTGIIGGVVNITVSVGETSRYLASEVNVTVKVNKLQSVISVNNITMSVGQIKPINATLNNDGTLRYINSNPEIIAIDESGMLLGFIGGTAKVTVIFDETEKYLPCEVNVTVTINKLHSIISIEETSLAINIDGNVLINATTNSDAVLTYQSLDKSIVAVNLNNVSGIKAGRAIVTVSVVETDIFLAKSVNVTVTVNKFDSIISIENEEISLSVDGKEQIMASTNSDAKLTFITYSSIVSIDGKGLVTAISNGTAEVIVSVGETDRYLANTSHVTVKVSKVPSVISVNESINLTVGDEANVNASLNHDGQLNYASLNESIVTIDSQGNIRAVKVGKAQIIVRFIENGKYAGDCLTVNVTVNKVDVNLTAAFNMNLKDASKSPTFSIDLANATGNFSVVVDGKVIGTVRLIDGKANITVPELDYGNHNVTVVYSGDDKYAGISQNSTVTILKPVLGDNRNVVMLYTSKAYYIVRLTVESRPVAGENVVFEFNGIKYTVKTDNNGYAKFKLPNVKPKKTKYAITAAFNDITVKNTVKVNSIIKAKNLKVKKSKRVLKIKVYLKKVNGKYLKGKMLKLKIKGKTLKAKTNKKGKATFKVKRNILKKLKAGKKYKYTVTYGKDKVTKKIKVKK